MARRRPLVTFDDAYEEAVRMLALKARSAAEVSDALLERGAIADDVESVIARLKAHRHLDDAELAADQAFLLLEGKGLSPQAIVQTLVARGVAAATAEEAAASVVEGRSDVEMCAQALSQRLKGRALDESGFARQGRALARLGWDEETVTRVLEEALKDAARAAQES